MRTAIFLSSLLTILLFINCDPENSEDINQDRISTDYSLTYNDNKTETEAAASFTFGSTPLRLTSPASITADDASMKQREFLGIVDYYKTFTQAKSQVRFDYSDLDGRTFTNTATIPNEIQMPASLTTFSRTQDQIIEWVGSAIAEDESVFLEITKDDSYFSSSKSNIGSTSILLNASDLGTSFIGEVKIKISRQKTSELQEAPRNGKIRVTYTSKAIAVMVTE
ncbi:MAG: hypothetical protein ACJA08_001829 [Cyclobacteriaceae bacterium]|jgi:hypothetical protein